METVQQGEADLSFGSPVGLKLLWQQANLLSQLVHWFGGLGSRNLDVTTEAEKTYRLIYF